GAGSLLGEQQSGFISIIGYAMYIEMLATEIEKLKK
ncbi:partial Transcription-repair-coupling factor, partial [Patescibacteria group bacterium]